MPPTTRRMSGTRLIRHTIALAAMVWGAGFGLGFCTAVTR